MNDGGVAERLNAPVLKTGDTRVSVGSNPTPSAINYPIYKLFRLLPFLLLKKLKKLFLKNKKFSKLFFGPFRSSYRIWI